MDELREEIISLLNKECEIESDRLNFLKQVELNKGHDYEVHDRIYIVQSMFTDFVLEHPFIISDPDLYKTAYVIESLLINLYQEIGQKIMEKIEKDDRQ